MPPAERGADRTQTLNILYLTAGNTARSEIVVNCLSTLLAQWQVDTVITCSISITLDRNLTVGIVLQYTGKLSQISLCAAAESRTVSWEEDTRSKCYLNGRQAIGIFYSLNLCILHLFSLSLHLIHVLSDEVTSTATNSCTDSSTYESTGTTMAIVEQSTNESTQSCT